MIKRIAVYSGPKSEGNVISTLFAKRHVLFATVNDKTLTEENLPALYSCIIFGGGHSVVIGPRACRNVLSFVEKGGGFLGICAGLHFAAKARLINIDLKIVRGAGYYEIRLLKRHPLTKGFDIVVAGADEKRGPFEYPYNPTGRMFVRRCNGGFIKCGQGVEMIASYDNDNEFGAIVAGKRGKGRVVLMSPHPENSPESDLTKPNPIRIFFNAVEYISGTKMPVHYTEGKKSRVEDKIACFQQKLLLSIVDNLYAK